MHILALEPYHGGSHRAFLDGWQRHSRHQWTTLTLPPHHWKWRMRHAAVTLAAEANGLIATDMMNLAEFAGLACEAIRSLPRLLYFHENQLTYPDRRHEERDHHFAVTNLVSAVAADAVWFNSEYHRREFLAAMGTLLEQMPDYHLLAQLVGVERKSAVRYPGIDDPPLEHARREGGPLHLIWAARWEHDKDPDTLLAALELLDGQGIEFRLSLIGESFREAPQAIVTIRQRFAEQIARWGYQPSRAEYWRALAEADVFVSTAIHEFFGISAVEATAAGCYPLLPRRLAYPEVFGMEDPRQRQRHFYDGTADGLTGRLIDLAAAKEQGQLWPADSEGLAHAMNRFRWTELAGRYDSELESLAATGVKR